MWGSRCSNDEDIKSSGIWCHVNWSWDILGELPAFIFRSKRSWAPLTLKLAAEVSSAIHVFTNSHSITSHDTWISKIYLKLWTILLTKLFIVLPRKLRNYNFIRNSSKDSNGNEAKYLYNVLFCVPLLVNTMATLQHFPWQEGHLNSTCTMAGLLKIMSPTCSQHKLVW